MHNSYYIYSKFIQKYLKTFKNSKIEEIKDTNLS